MKILEQKINQRFDEERIKREDEESRIYNIINHRVSIFSLGLIGFAYDFLLVFVELTENINYNNDTLKEKENNLDKEIDNGFRIDLITNMYQEIKEKLQYSKDITINNKTGKVNNKQITDKETCIKTHTNLSHALKNI